LEAENPETVREALKSRKYKVPETLDEAKAFCELLLAEYDEFVRSHPQDEEAASK